MSNTYHDQLSGSDLHDNKAYPATGTPLPSWAQTDARYTRLQRMLNTTGPLTGGGDLSADRTIGIPVATSTTDGYLNHTDWGIFAGKQAAIGYAPVNRAGDTMTGNLVAALYDNGGQLYSVKVNGAVGDGVTDDTNAVKATITAMGTAVGILFLPAGNYLVTSAIPLPANITVVGAGLGNTKITTTMAASNLRGVFTISNKNNVTIQSIGFVVNGGSTAITSYGHDHLTLRDCAFTGTTNTANGGIVELCGQSSAGGVASMTDTLIDHCLFYDLTGTNARTIHLYPRDGHIVDRVTVVQCDFRNVGGPAVQLDAYDTCRGVRVLANDFINIRQGTVTGGITDACAVHAGLTMAYKVSNLLVEGNYYYNDNTAITEGGLVYVYGTYNTVINGNVAIGAWTSDYSVQGPCFAPGRTASPDVGLSITNNYIEGFNAFWDPDSMRAVTVSGNTVVRCGQAISTGYGGTQEYINYHGNVFYNCVGAASSYPGAIFLGNGNPKKCRIADNLIIDDRATPSTQYFLLLTGNFDFKDMEVSNNRFYMPNGTLSAVIQRELGNEKQPRTLRGNEIEDASGITREIVRVRGNVTGAITFDVSQGELVTATLTGNITVTFVAGTIKGQALELRLTQDSTGSRTVTWPSNFKKAGGSLALSTAANAQDIVVMRWSGSDWVEVSRALNVS